MNTTDTERRSEVPAIVRAPVQIGNRGITLTTMDELVRFAQAVSKSGLAPKGIETPEAIFVALEMGMEVGLPLMASLQNIAVINGRPTIWGDAQLAVVRSTGELEECSEWYEEKGKKLPRNPSTFTDDTMAVCRVKRRSQDAAETGFSVADAKRANLWGKAGPWTQYPARMLRFRARSSALRDQFGDALRGLRTAEEVMDDPIEVARNVTPESGRIAGPVFRKPDAIQQAQTDQPEPDPVEAAETADRHADPGTDNTVRSVRSARPEKTAAPTTPAPATTATETPQAQLEAIITGAGLTLDDYNRWATEEQETPMEWPAFGDVPTMIAARHVKAKTGLIRGVGALKGGVR